MRKILATGKTMELTRHQEAALFIIIGLYLFIMGLKAKILITESDIPATEDERARAKATPLGRVVVASLGTASGIYGLYLFFH
jgi:uncharacterized membrane protein